LTTDRHFTGQTSCRFWAWKTFCLLFRLPKLFYSWSFYSFRKQYMCGNTSCIKTSEWSYWES